MLFLGKVLTKIFLSKITDTQKNITSYKEQQDEHSDRIYAMSEHLRNVQQELQHTQVTKLIALAKLTQYDISNILSFDC